MEKLFDVYVEITGSCGVKGFKSEVNMLSFTGRAEGRYFSGKIIGAGVDTQRSSNGGEALLSARYMLEGIDVDGCSCRVFIENCGSFGGGFTPVIVTDSPALSKYETLPLKAEVSPRENGVTVTVYG